MGAAVSAEAKPKPGCDVALRLVHATIEAHQLQPLQAYEGLYVMAFGPPIARSRLAFRIRDAVAAKNQTTAAYLEAEYGEVYAGSAVRQFDEFRDKRLLGEFRTSKFLVVDGFETFCDLDPAGTPDPLRLALLREILAQRVREKRPTLLLFDALANLDLYLRGLLDEPKSTVNADKS